MITSEKIDQISKALVESQHDIGVAIKNAKSHHGKYADLATVIDCIKEPLNSHGIFFGQHLGQNDKGEDVLETVLIHGESAQWISCGIARVYCQQPNNPQAYGTGISYAKRYALMAALGLPTEDDDGGAGSSPKQEPVKFTDKQIEFAEKLKVSIEENLDGQPIKMDALQSYLIWSSKQTGKPIPDSDEKINPLTTYIINKTELLNKLKGAA